MAPHSSTLAWKIPWMEDTSASQTGGEPLSAPREPTEKLRDDPSQPSPLWWFITAALGKE